MDVRGSQPARRRRRDEGASRPFLQQRLPLGDLLDLRAFAEVCHSFAELYRIGVKVFDEAGQQARGREDRQRRLLRLHLVEARRAASQCIATVRRVKTRAAPRGAGPDHGRSASPGAATSCSRSSTRATSSAGSSSARSCPTTSSSCPAALARLAPDFDEKLAAGVPEEDPARAGRHRREDPEALHRSPRRDGLHRPQEPHHGAAAHRGGPGELPRAAGEEPAARGQLREAEGARPAQVELPRHHEPRAAHAAHERHRLLRDDARGARRAAHRRAARVPRHHHGEGREPPPAHHLHPRHLQDRGRPRAARALRRGRRPRSCATRSRRCSPLARKKGLQVACEAARDARASRATATSSASASSTSARTR